MYDPQFVRGLFDEMSRTYGVVNFVSSFGFCRRWRRQCLRGIQIDAPGHAVDLMTGMGELCPDLSRSVGETGQITAIDSSPVMCDAARRQAGRLAQQLAAIEIIEADALACPLPDGSADYVCSSFGLKTFSAGQVAVLAAEVARILRPGGRFSFVEISMPSARWLRWPYLFYLRFAIPLIGRLFSGNPENYRMLGVYTQAFGDCRNVARAFAAAGLDVESRSYFFGCATGITGAKPRPTAR